MSKKSIETIKCQYVPSCPFYNDKMPERPNNTAMKKNYCEGTFNKCARFHAATEAGCVADDLYPDNQ